MDNIFWGGFGAGFFVGWGAGCVLALLVRQYDRNRGYDRWRRSR